MNQWPKNKAYFWERYPFFRLLLPFVIGIVTYPQYMWTGNFLLYITIVLAACLFLFVRAQKHLLTLLSINVFFFFAAWALCYLTDVRNDQKWFGNNYSFSDSSIVVLTNKPVEKNRTWKLEVDVTHIVNNKKHGTVGKAFIYIYKYPSPPSFNEGDTILIPNKWQPIENRGNPFEFDYTEYCARNNIYLQQFLSADEVTLLHYATNDDLSWVRRVHYWCKRQLEWYIKDAATLGLLEAMLIGDKTELDSELKQAYADTGIVHTIAISGAHIGIFFVITFFLFSWIRHSKYRWVKYLAALPLIWLYVLVAGAPASAVRAATMFSILAVGFSLQKSPNGINQLLATALIMLCADPLLLYNIGFQLSFSAVLSIFIFYKPIYKLLSPTNRILRTMWGAIAASIAAEILVAPLVIYFFHLFPLQFIITNLLAYLFMGIILIMGMLIIATSSFTPIASVLGDVIIWLSSLFNKIVYQLQSLNFEDFHRLTLTTLELLLVFLLITTFSILLLKKKRTALIVSLLAIVCLCSSLVYKHYQAKHQEMLVIYYISGDCYIELIQGNTARLVYRILAPQPSTKQYVLSPAHTNWQVSNVDTNKYDQQIITVGKKTAYIYNEANENIGSDVDYFILTGHRFYLDIPKIKQVYSPELFVLGNNCSNKLKNLIKEECRSSGIPVHDVAQQGAFILSNN